MLANRGPLATGLILDCRSEELFAKGHLPGAINLPQDIEFFATWQDSMVKLAELLTQG